jgi:hypothetical protein
MRLLTHGAAPAKITKVEIRNRVDSDHRWAVRRRLAFFEQRTNEHIDRVMNDGPGGSSGSKVFNFPSGQHGTAMALARIRPPQERRRNATTL